MFKSDLIVCGGGTGGHFFSGVAVAEKFLEIFPDSSVVFVGTKNGIEARYTLSDPRMSVRFIAAKGIKGKSVFHKMKGVLYLIWGFFQSLGLVLRLRPAIVLGVGGYASAPTLFASILLRPIGRWRVAVLEQNSYAGLVNKLCSVFCNRAFSAFPLPRFELVDLPLREKLMKRAEKARAPSWPPRILLIAGGSQGARGLNEKLKQILPELHRAFPSLKVFHQTGKSDEETFRIFYSKEKMEAEVFSFSDDMPSYYEKADLLICRAGAMTVFEVMAFKRPCIFVPFPAATDDHQKKNALSVQDARWVVAENELSWERIKPLFESEFPAIPKRSGESISSWPDILCSLNRRFQNPSLYTHKNSS